MKTSRSFVSAFLNRPLGGVRRLLVASLALAGAAMVRAQTYTPYTVTTLSTGFSSPNGVAVDSSGNVYVADSNNYVVQKITSGGSVSVLAGSVGSAGTTDGTGGTARFGVLGGIAIDAAGANLYVTDWTTGNTSGVGVGSIRKIVIATGQVTTFVPASGGLNNPRGIAITSGGTLYVADSGNYQIQKVTSGGSMSVFAGLSSDQDYANGSAAATRFYFPTGVAVDSSGNVYVADPESNTIRELTSAGVSSTISGANTVSGYTDGAEAGALYHAPYGIAVDASGNIYIADTDNDTLRKISGGTVTTLAGSPVAPGNISAGNTDGTGLNARFWQPNGITVDSSGNLYVADTVNNSVRKAVSAGAAVAPAITTQPSSETVSAGAAANFTVVATGTAPLTYQWLLNGGPVTDGTGTNTANLIIASVATGDAGNYTVQVSNSAGTATSSAAVLAVMPVVAPVITSQPQSQTVNTGATVTFTVVATGTSPSYQWYDNNGNAISGATSTSLTLSNVTTASAGSYYVVVFNSAKTVPSNAAVLAVSTSSIAAPTITTQPVTQTIRSGNSVILSVVASSSASPTYQWYDGSTAISGATSSSLTLSGVGLSQAGSYTVQVTNSGGTTTSSPAMLTVNTGRLVNLSARANVGIGANILIAGYAIGGTGTKQILLRGVGPGLNNTFGLAGYLASTQLALYDNSQPTALVIATNTGWSNSVTAGNSLVQASPVKTSASFMNGVGAFALTATSADSAMQLTAPAGNYTAQVTGVNSTTGIALAEIYDGDSNTSGARLTNLSARANVGTSANILIGGFAISGNTPETVVIRAVGPGLGTTFGLTGYLANPVLTLYDNATPALVIASNTGWGTTPTRGNSAVTATIQAATAQSMANVGAFALSANSADSVMVATLPPGNYTAQVSGLNGTSGIALVEIYEVP